MEELFELAVTGILDRGYAVIDGFLNDAEVLTLRKRFLERRAKDAFSPAAIGQGEESQRVAAIRGDLIYWLEKEEAFPAEVAFINKMEDLMDYLNRTCYLGVRECEFHYAVYPPGTFYKRHLDQFQKDDARVLSVVTYLNEEWGTEDGGEIVLYLPKEGDQGEIAQKILPIGGRTVLFESGRLEHEVLPTTRDRMSITGWLRREKIL
ncbi:MAG: 2OG-Fe(II) oxygenase [Bacteroidia bacterium]|nr:2OG-Fe(II) oxygenase [Bacteroidia bacterium]